ncbi:S-adenosylmethionine--2-demethylmenaquinone methyltransferase [Streptomyces ipomoeae]|uniref:RraA family protein n=1 Tax=Streptomyces ipomoeae TaxID=103232 RepID=UPI0029BF7CED|nr:S-adenosylmethionine--2-demethylmenaquinone methyltransferase [Streptomyces ipomoeae]MDX2819549.1 S-adenosylmethionine--2-demethylmenaquinone methyltransferase [Streptomyces ipomoeae]MDX2873322.1 S-adenosylmethionine--2-demethylmenaquinone methyltransferase [Streptomyces ipomoeae]
MPITPIPTADLFDRYGDQLRVCDMRFTSYGAVRSFAGPVRTVSCHEDNALLHALLREPGDGAVVVVDGGASPRTALLADVRVGVRALGANPRRSGKAGKGEVDAPVTFGGVTFATGDILHADEDGVVLLPGSASIAKA